LTEEYSQLQEFTTLEKQLYIEDHLSELQEKIVKFLKQFKYVSKILSSDLDVTLPTVV